jgi:hypothetical protein
VTFAVTAALESARLVLAFRLMEAPSWMSRLSSLAFFASKVDGKDNPIVGGSGNSPRGAR